MLVCKMMLAEKIMKSKNCYNQIIAAVICEAMEPGKTFKLEQYIREQISSIIGGNSALIDRFVEESKTHAERCIHEMEVVMQMLEKKNAVNNVRCYKTKLYKYS